ncbi:MAG: archaetidylserine decarboxylase [Vicinamibacterales bacterium]
MSLATWLSVQLLRALPRSHVSRAVGRVCELPLSPGLSTAATGTFARLAGVDMRDVAPRDRPYPTFDAFFIRPLRPGARPVGRARVVSPADGRVVAMGRIASGGCFHVKQQDYTADELIGEDAAAYVGGSFAVVYLAPRDYHRVHAPVAGDVHLVRGMPGDLFPVNSLGERHVPRLLARNQRVVVFIETAELGRVAVVLVGAFIVGRITVGMVEGRVVPPGDHIVEPAVHVEPGDEIGVFHLGSTVVVLTGRECRPLRDIGPVQYGQALFD